MTGNLSPLIQVAKSSCYQVAKMPSCKAAKVLWKNILGIYKWRDRLASWAAVAAKKKHNKKTTKKEKQKNNNSFEDLNNNKK